MNWKPVVGWEGFYEVSDEGSVRSVPRTYIKATGTTGRVRGRVLRPGTHGIGHLHVMLCDRAGDRTRTYQIHLLVMAAFGPPRPEGTECCHNDGDPTNNHIDNLRWGTRSENNRDKVMHGRDHNASKSHCPYGHPYAGDNLRVHTTKQGWNARVCRTCHRERNRKYEKTRAAR